MHLQVLLIPYCAPDVSIACLYTFVNSQHHNHSRSTILTHPRCSAQAEQRREAAASKLGKWWRNHLHCRGARFALEVHRQLQAAKTPARLQQQEAAGQLICEFVSDAYRAYSFSKAVKLFLAKVGVCSKFEQHQSAVLGRCAVVDQVVRMTRVQPSRAVCACFSLPCM